MGKTQKVTATVALLACLSATEVHSDQILDNLVLTSQSIANSMDIGIRVVGGLANYGEEGGIAPIGTVDDSGALIAQEQVTAYNSALNAMANAEYYLFQDFAEDQAAEALESMEDAIDNFVEAAVDLTTVIQVQEMAEEAQETGNSQDAQDVSDFVAANEVGLQVDQETVDEYNSSLADIEEYSATAAIWTAASQNENIGNWADGVAESYDVSFTQASDAYFERQNDMIKVVWGEQGIALGVFGDANLNAYVDLSQILDAGEESEFYQQGPTANSYACFMYGDCE